MNTVNFVAIPASVFPDTEILVFGERRHTYAGLLDLINRISSVFRDLGLKPGEVVAVLDTNSDYYVAAYYAAAKSGLTFLPVNYRAKEPELEYMLNAAGVRALITGPRYFELVSKLRPKLTTVNSYLALGEQGPGMMRLEELAENATPNESEAEVDDNDTSVLMYTSGTTSAPKGVMLTYHDFTAYVTGNYEMADGTDRGTQLVCSPLYHIAGMVAIMTNLWSGRRLVLMPQFNAEEWLAMVAKERVTHAFLVPTMVKQLLECPAFDKADLSSLVNLAYGGAPMPLPVIREAIERFPKNVGFVNAYGQTETTSSLTVLGPEDHRIEGSPEEVERKLKRLNSIGRPLPDVEIAVRDENGKDLPPNQVGEICIRTPRMMKGYAGRKDDALLPDGFRATGDLGWIDEDGYVFFAGRKDDMIIRGGENIAPAEIETVLMSHPAVEEAAVIGVSSVKWGQTVKAFVVLRKGQKLTSEDLNAFCRERLASFKCPESYEFVDALPKNQLGKILRNELRAASGEAVPGMAASR